MTPGAANKSDIRTRQKQREETLLLQNAPDVLQLEERKNRYESERSVLRWGGIAGILGGIVFLFVPVILFGFIPPAPADPAGLVARFPDIRAALAAGGFVDFLAGVFWVALLLGLYRALRRTSPAPAAWGTYLTLLGFAVIFVETMTQVAFDPISNLYHAPGVTPAQQFALVSAWQATQGMFNQFDTSAIILESAGFIVLGVAMIRAPAFGRVLGWATSALGALSLSAGFFLGTTSPLTAILLIPIYVLLPIVLGWRLYSLSRSESSLVVTHGN